MQTGLFKSRIRNVELYTGYDIVERYYCAGDELDDYPDSPGSAQQLSGEAASQLLDSDNIAMDSIASGAGTSGESERAGLILKRRHNESSITSESQQSSAGPTLPPISSACSGKGSIS
jgi:hypothetical protein